MTEIFDIWTFLAGLGIFLFGIYMMEESIRLLSGRAFKRLIRRYTETRIKGIFSGIFSTAVLQSSTAVSLMVLAFVGAGVMSLANAIAVMMGAKIGTTMTAWIVALFGFQFSIESFALPLVGIGGLGLALLSGSPRYANISKLLAATGFLFLGLGFMKSSVEDVTAVIDLEALPQFGLWIYLLAGVVLTAITQSSSATIAIVLTMMFSNVIDFDQGASIVVGANIGTTTTVLISSIGAIPSKRQAAISQVIFAITSALLVFLLLPLLTWFILRLPLFAENPVLGMAMFHSVLNVIGVLLFYPLIPALVRFVQRVIPEPDQEISIYIRNTSEEIPEAAVEAIRKEIIHQLHLTMKFTTTRYGISAAAANGRSWHSASPEYRHLEQLHADIFKYYSRLLGQEVEEELVAGLELYLRASRSIMNSAKNLDEIHAQVEALLREDNPFLYNSGKTIRIRIAEMAELASMLTTGRVSDGTGSGGFSEGVTAEPEHSLSDSEFAAIENAYTRVEEADQTFIRGCASAIHSKEISENEITSLLMVNRTVTQSLRMLALSMQALVAPPEGEACELSEPEFESSSLEVLTHD